MRRIVTGLLIIGACAMAQSTTDYLDTTRVQVRGDKTKDFEDAIKKLAEVNRKYKGDNWIALSTEYGEFGGYTFSSPRSNLAAVETGMSAFQKALKEGLGPMGDKLMRDISADSASGYNQLRHRRWDLSVNKPEDLMTMIAGTRWIRLLTVNLKPGRAMEYAEAWKPFMSELQKVTPATPILVSEASTGTPAMFIGVYYKSFADMDAANEGVTKALQSAAYQRLTKVTQDAVNSSRWEIMKIRPELSCAPEEVVKVDPAFWKPKPAATTMTMAPKKTEGAAEKK